MEIVTAIVTRSTDSDECWISRHSYSAAADHADERHWQGNQHPGVANLRFSLVPDAYMQLTSGTVVQVCAAIPVTKTSGFPGTFADPAIDRVLLHQAVRLPLRPWSRWVAGLTQVSIGRFSQEEVSIADKNALTLLDEGLFAGGTLARREGPQHRSRNRAGILEARSVVSSLSSAVCRHPEAGGTQVD
jgi:hypothetical protein